ncbi:DegT/DnrJ/EryC1/StrS family aminotransferase [Tautonia plasticadhaerens]|uniref:L-glutamine:scyllo-inosose aminotransferase n=1 Tax=Tautonia plasticadhaerens TaxID=2527974 RepID=A0A518GWQ4_9BACT|nr:DegT/DnrJ/EryC1/StrS family aminotransferase [Tautonia plasticadhaerens]QDV33019.1 L-glutamine:scyllo-inosose aminotransferase [Tautonia plasticadhaerens]
MTPSFSRRTLIGASTALGMIARPGRVRGSTPNAKPAVLGGEPVRKKAFPGWPIVGDEDVSALVDVLRSGAWYRGSGDRVRRFEAEWADRLGVSHCVATANGTSALITAMNALEVGPGDEVIVPPYTFVATVNAVLIQHALPVFVDVDPETSQIDASKIAGAITDRTRAIVPVHIGGNPADLDAVMAVARDRGIPVVEDACQAHLAEWRGKKVGTIGDLGCFSFQNSKNLTSGEGGAVLTDDARLHAECLSFQNNGRSEGDMPGTFGRNGANLRLTEFQGALLSTQLTRLESQARTREQNAASLSALLDEIPGVTPARMHEGTTRNAYHLYMFRYDPAEFAGLPRSGFLKAMAAEGIPASGGYSPLYREPFLRRTLESRAFRASFPSSTLAEYEERLDLPGNERLCEEAVWLTQSMLLGTRQDMEQVAEAIRKIRAHASEIAKA